MSGSTSSSASSFNGSSSRPQQYGLITIDHGNILRQRPPSAQSGGSSSLDYYYHPHHPHRSSGSNRSHYSNVSTPTVSPYLSPASSFQQFQQQSAREQLPPLILDPSVNRNATKTINSDTFNRPQRPHHYGVMHKLLDAARGGRRQQHHLPPPASNRVAPVQVIESSAINPHNSCLAEETAGHFARLASRAGYLQKLGTTIPEFKRRFFVLQPGTHLYYFLSPNDTEPRGCFDLDGSRVEEVDHLPDGRYRFALVWDNDGDGHHQIVLEARSKQVGQEWLKSLESERLSFCRAECQDLQRQNAIYQCRISDMEQTIVDYQHVESDRDAAWKEAARWKDRFERLDEALRLLAQQIRHPESNEYVLNNNCNAETAEKSTDEVKAATTENELDNNPTTDTDVHPDLNVSHDLSTTASVLNSSHRDTSLLDSVADEELTSDEIHVPGMHFATLSNACQQLKDNLLSATTDASTAVADLNAANEKVQASEKRLGKAEKYLCTLWEENCSIRKALKQKKQEKKILVKEYKSLCANNGSAQSTRSMNHSQQLPNSHPVLPSVDTSLDEGSVMTNSEEERLMNEIEESVVSSIKLHEGFLEAGRVLHKTADDGKMRQQNRLPLLLPVNNASLRLESAASDTTGPPLQPKLLSLFDDDDDDTADDKDDEDHLSLAPSCVSSVGADYGESSVKLQEDNISIPDQDGTNASQVDTPERRNPLDQLDDDDDEEEEELRPNLCAASSQSESSRSLVTDNGRATARLACPLADVVAMQNGSRRAGGERQQSEEDGRVYHLTFYTQKIGIQFQKVPPPPLAPNGLLTEAMTAELGADPSDGNKTATELRRVTEFTALAKSGESSVDDQFCKVAGPVDAVLICGFVGFDDSANRIRPKLGARLVAFDGVSVEAGQWTFNSIRKAIHARGRPLTLSFRNDFLTTEQRTVLTRAVSEVGKFSSSSSLLPSRATSAAIRQYNANSRPSSADPSVQSAISHESDTFVNQGCDDAHSQSSSHYSSQTNNDDLSTVASEHSFPPSRMSFSATRRAPDTNNSNFRSFSEAGSSSVLSAAFAPLMSNLMTGLATKRQNGATLSSFTPEYLKRESGSLDNTPQHQDFKANLL